MQEPGTDRLLPLAATHPQNRLAVLAITAVEFRSAIRRRERAGDIDAAGASSILNSLQTHLETVFIRQAVNDAVIDAALEMIDRYVLGAYDAMRLAGCLVLSSIGAESYTFVCSGQRLLAEAEAEQLRAFDPNAWTGGQVAGGRQAVGRSIRGRIAACGGLHGSGRSPDTASVRHAR